MAAFAQSNYAGAVATYDQALAIMRRDPEVSPAQLALVHLNKATVFKYSRQFEQAIASLTKGAQLDPRNSDIARERQDVERARDRHSRLIDQGLGAN